MIHCSFIFNFKISFRMAIRKHPNEKIPESVLHFIKKKKLFILNNIFLRRFKSLSASSLYASGHLSFQKYLHYCYILYLMITN